MDKEEKEVIQDETAAPAVEEAISETGAGEALTTAPEEVDEKPKHKYADRLSKAFPDREYASDDEYDSAMEEYLTGLEGYKERG